MAEYYGVSRSDEYLAHYGVKGMKWGVRKAIASGNDRALGRQFKKAQKKLAKLEKRANSGKKYAARAAALGAGAGIAGAVAGIGPRKMTAHGVAAANKYLGGGAAAKIARLDAGKKIIQATNGRNTIGSAVSAANKTLGGGAAAKIARLDAGKQAMDAVKRGAATSNKYLGGGVAGKTARLNAGRDLVNKGVSTNTLMRLGAGAVGAGLAGAAGYNAYRAATTKRAGRKAAQFRSEMQKSFAGTRYANQVGQPRKKKRR